MAYVKKTQICIFDICVWNGDATCHQNFAKKSLVWPNNIFWIKLQIAFFVEYSTRGPRYPRFYFVLFVEQWFPTRVPRSLLTVSAKCRIFSTFATILSVANQFYTPRAPQSSSLGIQKFHLKFKKGSVITKMLKNNDVDNLAIVISLPNLTNLISTTLAKDLLL